MWRWEVMHFRASVLKIRKDSVHLIIKGLPKENLETI